jgi:hypothetical protein
MAIHVSNARAGLILHPSLRGGSKETLDAPVRGGK